MGKGLFFRRGEAESLAAVEAEAEIPAAAPPRRADPLEALPRNVTVISASMALKGFNASSTEDVVVFGQLVGDFDCATLYVAEGAAVEGKVRAECIKVMGSLDGVFEAGAVRAYKTAAISGEVRCKTFSSQGGCAIHARVDAEASESLSDSPPLPLAAPPPVFAPAPREEGPEFAEKDKVVHFGRAIA